MVFSSLTFLFAFLPVSLLLYYVVPGKWKDVVLFAVSLLFYAWGEPVYVFLMLYSIILNYFLNKKEVYEDILSFIQTDVLGD